MKGPPKPSAGPRTRGPLAATFLLTLYDISWVFRSCFLWHSLTLYDLPCTSMVFNDHLWSCMTFHECLDGIFHGHDHGFYEQPYITFYILPCVSRWCFHWPFMKFDDLARISMGFLDLPWPSITSYECLDIVFNDFPWHVGHVGLLL